MKTKNKQIQDSVVWYSEVLHQQSQKSERLYHFQNGWPMRQVIDGVYITPEIYLILHESFKEKISLSEARALCAKKLAQFPSDYEILMFGLAKNKISSLLTSIGIYSGPVAEKEDVFSCCWTRENMTGDSKKKKYLLLFGNDGRMVFPNLSFGDGGSFALIEQVRLYECVAGSWRKGRLSLLAGDECSNLLLSETGRLFLQYEQKLFWYGKCKRVWGNDILSCDTGVFQYHCGKMHCLLELDPAESLHNNANSGSERYVNDIEWEQDGEELVILMEDYVWCDHHEQERSDIIPLRYRKNEEGVFVRHCQSI